MPALAGGTTCFAHTNNAAAASQRDQARRVGGESRAAQMSRGASAAELLAMPPEWWGLSTATDACNALAYVAREVFLGKLTARDANAATSALSALASVRRDVELERRLAVMETALGVGGKRR
jgi:hypothetical protein